MSKYPDDLKYTKEHEWARIDGTKATIGITQFAVDQLGDITQVELPKEEPVRGFAVGGSVHDAHGAQFQIDQTGGRGPWRGGLADLIAEDFPILDQLRLPFRLRVVRQLHDIGRAA